MFKSRVYVCHTYYHVYVALLKEFALPKEEQKKATIVLSKMSSDFADLKERLESQGLFEEVVEYDEKPFWFFKELDKYKKDYHNFVKNTVNRIIFTKKFAKLQAQYVPINFKEYKDIYVFCDSDPIGYYLSANRIRYHALEDGLNCLVYVDGARYDNRGHFKIKAFLSALNLIFIQNGYGKYCIDMEINSLEGILYPIKKHKVVPRAGLFARLTPEEKEAIINVFVKDKEILLGNMSDLNQGRKNYLILTEQLCDLETRKQIFRDLVEQYEVEANICIKPHPRDELDYAEVFPNILVLDKLVPMEVLNCLGEQFFDLAISVFTDVTGIYFAKETLRLGADFMDKYEEASIHRQNEQI